MARIWLGVGVTGSRYGFVMIPRSTADMAERGEERGGIGRKDDFCCAGFSGSLLKKSTRAVILKPGAFCRAEESALFSLERHEKQVLRCAQNDCKIDISTSC